MGVEISLVMLGGILALALSIPLMSGKAFIFERGAVILAFSLLALIFRQKSKREGLTWQDLGYHRPARPLVIAGLIAGVLLLFVVGEVTGPLDSFLFPQGEKVEADFLRRLREGGILGSVLILPGNGLLGPIVEEYAWRGYIQSRFTEGMGLRYGVAVTALLFAVKHIVVDVSLFRTTTLLVGGFALGLIRIRWGTTTTTIAHIFLNSVATLLVMAAAFGWFSD